MRGGIIQELGGGFLRNQHSGEAKEISGKCWRCGNQMRRYGHPLQDCPLDSTLAPFIRRSETQRARHKNLDVAALEARWQTVVDTCRGSVEPSFREKVS